MLRSVEGVYRNGRIELSELPADIREETRVLVTFLQTPPIDLREHGIDEKKALELRARLASFAADWESPDMDIYNDYDAAKAAL